MPLALYPQNVMLIRTAAFPENPFRFSRNKQVIRKFTPYRKSSCLISKEKCPRRVFSPLWAFYLLYALCWWALCPLKPLHLPLPVFISCSSYYRSSMRPRNALCNSTLRHRCTYLPGSFRKSRRSSNFRFWMILSLNHHCCLPLPILT